MLSRRFQTLCNDSHTIFTPKEVGTGEIRTGGAGDLLVASALGSCVAVVAYDPCRSIGGMAHVMLPGRAPESVVGKFRYAEDAVDELFARLTSLGSLEDALSLCIAGGGNVLRRSDDVICEMNIRSVHEIMKRKAIPIMASSVGGFERRRVAFNVGAGCVRCAEGNSAETILWKWSSA